MSKADTESIPMETRKPKASALAPKMKGNNEAPAPPPAVIILEAPPDCFANVLVAIAIRKPQIGPIKKPITPYSSKLKVTLVLNAKTNSVKDIIP